MSQINYTKLWHKVRPHVKLHRELKPSDDTNRWHKVMTNCDDTKWWHKVTSQSYYTTFFKQSDDTKW